jgi:large subunit ribosomal protein L2
MLKDYRPTSAGKRVRRSLVRMVSKKRPEKTLVKMMVGPVAKSGGTISSRHRQRGARKYYRIIDFKRDKFDIPAKVVAIEYDPNRGPNIALLNYADGEKRYILVPEGLQVGMTVVSTRKDDKIEVSVGSTAKLGIVPLGTEVHNIEMIPGRGAQMVRGAGNVGIVMAKEDKYVNIKLPSGEVRRFQADCLATFGRLSNSELRSVNLGKAGRKRHLGYRPHVRGVAVANPRQHPHGGSYKDNGVGMAPVSPWGWKTKGKKTRRRTSTNRLIVSRRQKRR